MVNNNNKHPHPTAPRKQRGGRTDAKLKQTLHLLTRALTDSKLAGKHHKKPGSPKPGSSVRTRRGGLVEQVHDQVEHLLRRYQELHHKYLSHLASSENYKKQLAAEQQDIIKYRASGIAQHLLPALDNFELALAVKQSDPAVQNYLEGFHMIYKLIADAFAREGIKIIPTKVGDQFDHNIHNAMTTEYQAGVDPHRILKVVKKGYRLSDRVLRHSVVVVSAPTGSTGKAEPQQKHYQTKERKN